MSPTTTWIVLSLIAQVSLPMLNPRGYQRGRILTMPMRRMFPKLFDHAACRIAQLFCLVPLDWFAHSVSSADTTISIVFSIVVIALYFDDWLTNHDDFKKKWDWVRNKIKWKMKLPVPAPAGSKVG